jgi:penicillin-binding protein 1A
MRPVKRKINRKKPNKPALKDRFTRKKVLVWGGVSFFGSVALFTLLVLLMFLYYSYGASLPSVDSLKDYKPVQSVKIMDRNGTFIAYLGKRKRTVVKYSKIPETLIQAVISAEDSSFFNHKGLNYMGMVRAFWVNLMAGRFKQGGSTITQQVVKTLLLSPERTLRRKFHEVILARRLESTLSKKEILNIYLNEIYMGHGRYGVEEASRFYFKKHIWEINIQEAALLAGLPQGPEYNSPIRHPKRAKARQLYVLKQMLKNGYITKNDVKKAGKKGLPLKLDKKLNSKQAPEIVDLVKAHIKKYSLKLAGKEVITTIDLEMQKRARKILQKGLRVIDKRNHVTKLKHLSVRKLNKHLSKLKAKAPLRSGPTYEGVVTGKENGKIIVNLGSNKGVIVDSFERYYPDGFRWNPRPEPKRKKRSRKKKIKHKKPSIRVGDLFKVVVLAGKSKIKSAPLRLRAELGPQGTVLMMDVKNRDVLVMLGGYTMKPGDYNRVLRAKRQPGSSFKPFVYAAALDSKLFTTASLLNDGPEVYNKWVPRNHGAFLGIVTLRTALTKSINSIAVYLLKKVGVSRVASLAKSSGITATIRKDLSIALGSSEVTLLDMVTSYGIFPSRGISRKPRFFKKIGDDIIPIEAGSRALGEGAAWLTLSLMRSVVKRGTGRRARKLRFPVAGKTGTTNRSRDTWFIGFTPDFICGVWVGYDDHRPLGRKETGGRTAIPIFNEIIKLAVKKRKNSFKMGGGIVSRLIDPKTGKAVFPGTKGAVSEYFLSGTEPGLPVAPPSIVPEDNDDDDDDSDDKTEDLLTE